MLRRVERAGGQAGEKPPGAGWEAGVRGRSGLFVSARPGHPHPGGGAAFCTTVRSFIPGHFFFFSLPNRELGLWILRDGLV